MTINHDDRELHNHDDRELHAVGYIRVSTDRQADRGFGLDVQHQAVIEWAKSFGANLTGICRDEGVSGTTDPTERAGLSQALSMVADGQANVLVLPKLDRLARTLSIQEACLAKLWSWGARVFACDLGEIVRDDASDPMRTALRQMVAVFGQLERSMITSRMRDGRSRKAELGGYAYGAPPFGTESHEGTLIDNPIEIETIRRITELRGQGNTLLQIADILTSEGHSPRRSDQWHPQTIKRIIDRRGNGPAKGAVK